MQGHAGIFLQFGSLIKYFKDVKLERQPALVHHYEGSGIAKVCLTSPLPASRRNLFCLREKADAIALSFKAAPLQAQLVSSASVDPVWGFNQWASPAARLQRFSN